MSKSGVVKFFNDEKGFGFITQNDGGPDLFVHRTAVSGEALLEGDVVSFTEGYDDRSGKTRAENVSGGTGGEGSGGGGFGGSKGGYGGGKGGGGGGYGGGGGFGGGGGGGYGGGKGGGGFGKGGGKGGGGGKGPVNGNTEGPGAGTMVRWQAEKGFGFVKPDDGGDDLFVHMSNLVDGDGSVQEGDRVSYSCEYDNRKGKYGAAQVRRG